jgi:hypothetical protein
MYKAAPKGGEIGSGKGVLRENRSAPGRSDKSYQIGTAMTAEVKGVAAA